jgi:predicted trehalose synthase
VILKPETLGVLERWAKFWYRRVSVEYLASYLATPGIAALMPDKPEQTRAMLRLFLVDSALKKLAFEITHAPERIRIPSHAILELLENS